MHIKDNSTNFRCSMHLSLWATLKSPATETDLNPSKKLRGAINMQTGNTSRNDQHEKWSTLRSGSGARGKSNLKEAFSSICFSPTYRVSPVLHHYLHFHKNLLSWTWIFKWQHFWGSTQIIKNENTVVMQRAYHPCTMKVLIKKPPTTYTKPPNHKIPQQNTPVWFFFHIQN